jgi:hydrogenase expression/formation protein HypC
VNNSRFNLEFEIATRNVLKKYSKIFKLNIKLYNLKNLNFCKIKNGEYFMCIAAPAQIVEINDSDKIAVVDFGGVRQQVKLDLVEGVEEGRYVLVHSGYAIEVMTDEAAKESLEAWDELLKVLDEEDQQNL